MTMYLVAKFDLYPTDEVEDAIKKSWPWLAESGSPYGVNAAIQASMELANFEIDPFSGWFNQRDGSGGGYRNGYKFSWWKLEELRKTCNKVLDDPARNANLLCGSEKYSFGLDLGDRKDGRVYLEEVTRMVDAIDRAEKLGGEYEYRKRPVD